MKSDQLANSSIMVYVLAGVFPATSCVALAQMPSPKASLQALLLIVVLSFLVTVTFGFVLGGRASVILIAASGLGGICLGVIANAIYDMYANNIDHNMFPFEIIVDAYLIMPGVLLGFAIGSLRYYRKRKE
jgi:hypothetical protein